MSNISNNIIFALAVSLMGCGAGTPLNLMPASSTDVAVSDAVVPANRDVVSNDVQCAAPLRCGDPSIESPINRPCEILGTMCGRRTCYPDRNGCPVWAYSRP